MTVSEIVRETGLDFKTVRKYMKMDEKEFMRYLEKIRNRTKSFDEYREEILEVYGANVGRKISKSAVFDFLEETHETLPGTERTFRNYIDYLIETGGLLSNQSSRPYNPVPEQQWGKQMQADFGQYKTKGGLLIYIFAAVLSRSRHKYVAFQDRPFNTIDIIRHLLETFVFWGGMPEELVIDQDRALVVSENHGDIIFTGDFATFTNEMALRLFVCRKSDPESKGRVENLVGFVKHNFLDPRSFGPDEIELANSGLRKWLVRRANGKICMATRMVPTDMLEEEKKHLRPVRNSVFMNNKIQCREARKADKMCLVSVNSNLYQVPETFRNREVEIFKTRDQLFMYNPQNGEQIAQYTVGLVPGTKHSLKRSWEKREEKFHELEKELKELFPFGEWETFVERNRRKYPRYFRDQYHYVRKHFSGEIALEHFRIAVKHCLENDLFSMAELSDAYRFFKDDAGSTQKEFSTSASHAVNHGVNKVSAGLKVAKRSLAFYREVCGEPAQVNVEISQEAVNE